MRQDIITLLLVFGLTACGQNDEFKITRSEFMEGIKDSTAIVVDVRTPDEFATVRIPGSVNYDIKSDDFEEQVKDLDRSAALYLYCRSGRRSNTAAIKLTELGFEKVYDLEGGILGWTEDGLPADSASLQITN